MKNTDSESPAPRWEPNPIGIATALVILSLVLFIWFHSTGTDRLIKQHDEFMREFDTVHDDGEVTVRRVIIDGRAYLVTSDGAIVREE
jgi:hypothetical protein